VGTAPLKRDPALVPLSQDHHDALVQAQALTRAAEGRAPYDREGAAMRVAKAFLVFQKNELAGHFADEEDVLFPEATRVDAEGTGRVASDHARLRALTLALESALAAGAAPEGVMKELGARLHDHVRFEERVWFETLQARLGAEALLRLQDALVAHRKARGRDSATCALPPPR
jgi:hypothetical protein